MAPRPLSVFTREIATKDSPGEKSFGPRSSTAWVSVSPWLLWIVIAQANANGNWVRESDVPDLFSQRAVTGTMGIQVGSMLFHPGVAGPKNNKSSLDIDIIDLYYVHTWIAITLYKDHSWKIFFWIRSWIVPYLFDNALTTINQTWEFRY